jgi:peroxiredoxin Q/BCP
MKRFFGILAGVVLSSNVVAADLKVGQLAPNFSLPGSDGKTYTLSDYRGVRAVVVAWFPKAFTHGCTIECKSLAANGDKIRAFDVEYFMASVDDIEDNTGFAEETAADFPILSDVDKSVAEAYDVLYPVVNIAKRHTIYIDKQGIVSKIDTNVNPETSAEDMVNNLATLGVAKR